MEKIHLKIIIGSTREGRFGEKAAQWFYEVAQKNENIIPELIDLKDWPLPFYDEAGTPGALKGEYKNELAKKWVAKVGEGDAYVFIAPEYNHGYSAVLKNAIDWVYYEWNKKPISFVSYGSANGARAVEQLRQVAVELQMAPIRSAVHIPNPWSVEIKDGKADLATFQTPAENMLAQLLWWAEALKIARNK